tara:strand:- start:3250 stop:3522 length:273 start_codon:yes stop_codon:yes gene_type:complete
MSTKVKKTETKKTEKGIILTIEGHRYEVSAFDHPGDGIKGIEVHNMGGKDVSEGFEEYHMTDDPWEMLQEARENGECDGIKYLGPTEKSE